jgi:biofilm PGA synthesis protein PgaD
VNAPIIERPELQTGAQRLVYGVLTALAWLAWAYLTWPFLGIIVTACGVPVVSEQEVVHYSANLITELQRIMWWCVITVMLCVTLFPSWAGYHIVRFANATKRKTNLRSGVEKLASDFQVPAELVILVQDAKRIVLETDHLSLRVADGTTSAHARDISRAVRAAA